MSWSEWWAVWYVGWRRITGYQLLLSAEFVIVTISCEVQNSVDLLERFYGCLVGGAAYFSLVIVRFENMSSKQLEGCVVSAHGDFVDILSPGPILVGCCFSHQPENMVEVSVTKLSGDLDDDDDYYDFDDDDDYYDDDDDDYYDDDDDDLY
jgi:hypothetical protein